MTTSTDPPPASGAQLAADLGVDVASLDKELTEIDMLIGQAGPRRAGTSRSAPSWPRS